MHTRAEEPDFLETDYIVRGGSLISCQSDSLGTDIRSANGARVRLVSHASRGCS